MKQLIQDVFDIPDCDNYDSIMELRNKSMDKILMERSKYYIAHFPTRSVENRWELVTSSDYARLFEAMSIKEGVNMYEIENGFQFVAYYGSYKEKLNLYPITVKQADELQKIINESDFDESIVIDKEISQYMWS